MFRSLPARLTTVVQIVGIALEVDFSVFFSPRTSDMLHWSLQSEIWRRRVNHTWVDNDVITSFLSMLAVLAAMM